MICRYIITGTARLLRNNYAFLFYLCAIIRFLEVLVEVYDMLRKRSFPLVYPLCYQETENRAITIICHCFLLFAYAVKKQHRFICEIKVDILTLLP